MVFVPFIGIALGVFLAFLMKLGPVTNEAGIYLSVACLAGLDSLCGGIRSGLEGKYSNDVFISGFFTNVLIAFFLAWLGDRIGNNLNLVAALVFGTRIFTNLSLIRRFVVTKWQDDRARRRASAAQSQANS